MHNIWDTLIKVVGDKYPEEIVDYIFPNKKIKIAHKFEQQRIAVEYQISDINFWIIDKNGHKKILNIEPYSQWNNNIPSKVFTRNAIITKSFRLPDL